MQVIRPPVSGDGVTIEVSGTGVVSALDAGVSTQAELDALAAALAAHAALDLSDGHPGTIDTPDIADGAVTAAKVAADVATQAELDAVSAALAAHAALDLSDGHPGTIDTPDIADGAVTAAKVAADVATQAELDAVSAALAAHAALDLSDGHPGTIDTPDIADGAVTAAKAASASYFSFARGDVNADWDTLTNPGTYTVRPAGMAFANAPNVTFPTIYDYGILVVHVDQGHAVQRYFPHDNGSTGFSARRVKLDGVWANWHRDFTNLTDGAGSGLDADLLDGQSSAYYATAAALAAHEALDISDAHGGTIDTPDIADGAVTAAKVAADVATQAELDAAVASLFPGATSPSRALNTVYQNTGTTPRLVVIYFTTAATIPHLYTLKVGAANPPATAVSQESSGVAGSRNMVFFIVGAGQYYELDQTTTNTNPATISVWQEAQ